ncbi:35426_t:CDS:10, partial [Gigaspora margarita]
MSVIRPVIPENKEILEWCSDFSKLETYFDKVPLDKQQEVGGQKLKSLLSETEFPGPVPISSNNPITFSLSTHQFQSVRVACKIIQKTRLYLQHIEQNIPINVQPAVFHALIPLGNHSYSRDPRHDPIVLFHRWIIRSKYNGVNCGFEFDPDEKSAVVLENLYERLGEYYFSRNSEKSFYYLCKCRLEGHPYDRTKEYKTFCTIDQDRLSALIKGTSVITTFPPSEQINYFKGDLDYEGVYKVLLISFEKNDSSIMSMEETRALVDQAIKFHKEFAAIKIAVYNALIFQSNASVDDMLSEVPVQCIQYFHNNFDEQVVKDIIELVKTIYGNFPGVKLSVNQRKFLSLFFEKLDNGKVWDAIRKTEGLEFVQYPLEKIIEPLVLLNTRCKSANVFKHKTNGNKKSSQSQETRLNIVHDDFQIPKSLKHIQLRPSRPPSTIPLIFQPLNQSSRIGRNVSQNAISSRWKTVEEFINSACYQQSLDNSKLEHMESLCNNALDDALRMDLQDLEDTVRILMDNSRWQFLSKFFTNMLKLKSKNEFKLAYSAQYHFCQFMLSCIRLLKLYSKYVQDNYNVGSDYESIYQKEFDVIFSMDYDDVRSLRVSTHKLIKALTLLDNKNMELSLRILTKLKNLKWAHQVIGCLIVGYLCSRQSQLGRKQLNSQLYGPLTILLMSTECAQRHWPEKSQVSLFYNLIDCREKISILIKLRIVRFNKIAHVLDEKIKPIRLDFTHLLIQLCIESAKYNNPKYCYYLRLANIYCLQGSPLKSLSMEAIALKTSFYMFLDKINELWPMHTIKQMILCSLSRKEPIAAIVLHQFIQHEFGCLNETKPLLDLAINDGTLQKSIFTKFIFDVQVLEHICKYLYSRGETVEFNEISKWLRSHLEEQAPSIFSKGYTFSENDKQTKFKNYVKHKSQKEVIGVDIDPTHQEIVIEELKRQFMYTVLEWIDEENE